MALALRGGRKRPSVSVIRRPKGQLRTGQNAAADLPHALIFASAENYRHPKETLRVQYRINDSVSPLDSRLSAGDLPEFAVLGAGKIPLARFPLSEVKD